MFACKVLLVIAFFYVLPMDGYSLLTNPNYYNAYDVNDENSRYYDTYHYYYPNAGINGWYGRRNFNPGFSRSQAQGEIKGRKQQPGVIQSR